MNNYENYGFSEFVRTTKETDIKGSLNLKGNGDFNIECKVGFFKHMLESFTRHGGFDLDLSIKGDLYVDQHHMVEDTGIVLGSLFRKAIGNGIGIERAAFFIQQMDDSIVTTTVDISGRPYLIYKAKLKRRFCGDFDTDLLIEFFRAFTNSCKCNLYINVLEGENDHHIVEAIFKSFGKILRKACSKNENNILISTKGSLLEEL